MSPLTDLLLRGIREVAALQGGAGTGTAMHWFNTELPTDGMRFEFPIVRAYMAVNGR